MYYVVAASPLLLDLSLWELISSTKEPEPLPCTTSDSGSDSDNSAVSVKIGFLNTALVDSTRGQSLKVQINQAVLPYFKDSLNLRMDLHSSCFMEEVIWEVLVTKAEKCFFKFQLSQWLI